MTNKNKRHLDSFKFKQSFDPQKRIAELKLENRHLEESLQRLYDFKTLSKDELLRKGYTPRAVFAQRSTEDYLRYPKTVSHIKMRIAINNNEIDLLNHYILGTNN